MARQVARRHRRGGGQVLWLAGRLRQPGRMSISVAAAAGSCATWVTLLKCYSNNGRPAPGTMLLPAARRGGPREGRSLKQHVLQNWQP